MSRPLVLAVLALLASACAAPTQGLRDSGPPRPVDVSHVRDAQPRVEPRSKTGNPPFYFVFGKRYEVMPTAIGYSERGLASWYGTKFHGRKTSSGEPYDMYAMTAAHKALPLPAYATVTNLKNGRQVVVKINDRGPFHPDRIIDLSYAAAAKLDIARHGVGMVEVTVINPATPAIQMTSAADTPATTDTTNAATTPTPPSEAQIWLQVGAFSSRENAQQLRDKLAEARVAAVNVSELQQPQATLYRVRVGPMQDPETADKLAEALRNRGLAEPRIVVE